MTVEWSLMTSLLLSWKYMLFLLLALAGWILLSRNRPMRRSRLVLQGISFLTLGGILGIFLPWAAQAFGLHPSPMCSFGKGIAFPVVSGRIGHPMTLLVGAVVLFTLVGGKAFCAWVCPLGAFQELIGRIPGLGRHRLSFRLTNTIRAAAMALFFVVLFTAARITYDYFNPFEALHWTGLTKPLVWIPLVSVALASLYVYRPFCSLFCPIGLLSWAVERASFGKIRVAPDCNGCGVCLKKTDCQALPALLERSRVVPDCHGCGDCLGTCPTNALSWSWGRRRDAGA
ncbi:MAG: 4Fe-4S binding protein [Candidatus Eisenbacteria bacterium]